MDEQEPVNKGSGLTDLYEMLMKKLHHHLTPQSLKNKHFLDQITTILLIKKPLTHTFICDQKLSIQIQFKTQKKNPLAQYNLDPFNKVCTHYYEIAPDHTKYLYSLNCSDKTLWQKYGIKKSSMSQTYYNEQNYSGGMFNDEQAGGNLFDKIDKEYQPHPYEPLYYFQRKDFQAYLKERDKLFFAEPLDKIIIYDWVLKVVNISRNGSYAFVIEVHKFRNLGEKIYLDNISKQKDKSIPEVKNIGSILYEQKFQSILQKMRLKHIKQSLKNLTEQNRQEQISMCYHLRNVQPSHKLPKTSQLVHLDKQNQILKFKSNELKYYLPVGQLQGMCTFAQAINLNVKQKQQHLKDYNNFSMKALYQVLNKDAIKSKSDRKQNKNMKNMRYGQGDQQKNRMREQRFRNNSYYLMRRYQNGLLGSTFQSQDQQDSLFTDSNQQGQNQREEEQKKNQGENAYQNLLDEQNSSSSSEEQNEYFRKYRQQLEMERKRNTLQRENRNKDQNQNQN